MKNNLILAIIISKNDSNYQNVVKFLRSFKINLQIILSTNKRNENLENFFSKRKYDIIINYSSYFILPKKIIKKAKYCCLNFHPGPPKYRGSGIMSWALINNEKFFGVTSHFVDEKIDHGRIIDVLNFRIPKNCNIQLLIDLTKKYQFKIFKKTMKNIFNQKNNLYTYFKRLSDKSKYKWSKKIYKITEIDELQRIRLNNKQEQKIFKIIKSTYIGDFSPVIEVGKYKFKIIK